VTSGWSLILQLNTVTLDAFNDFCVTFTKKQNVCSTQQRFVLQNTKQFSCYLMCTCSCSINPRISVLGNVQLVLWRCNLLGNKVLTAELSVWEAQKKTGQCSNATISIQLEDGSRQSWQVLRDLLDEELGCRWKSGATQWYSPLNYI